MRAVVQRVTRAQVSVDSEVVGAIERGFCVLVGVMSGDDSEHAARLAKKVAQLRVFEDEQGRMNRDLTEVGGAVLAVSQFTLAGDVRKGNRPSFQAAMDPEPARTLFEQFCGALRERGLAVETGRFRAHMEVSLVNDGPVTILLDSERQF